MTKGRYQITVRRDRKVVYRSSYGSYDIAMLMLDKLERESLTDGTYVEFRDTDPFQERI